MRRINEKRMIIAELVALIFIALSTIFVEISDEIIDNWQNKVFMIQNNLNNRMLIVIDNKISHSHYNLLCHLKIYDIESVLPKALILNNEVKEIYEKFKAGKTSGSEFLNKLSDINFDLYNKGLDEYNVGVQLGDKFFKKEPKAKLVKRFFNTVRIIAILFAIVLYFRIYHSINIKC